MALGRQDRTLAAWFGGVGVSALALVGAAAAGDADKTPRTLAVVEQEGARKFSPGACTGTNKDGTLFHGFEVPSGIGDEKLCLQSSPIASPPIAGQSIGVGSSLSNVEFVSSATTSHEGRGCAERLDDLDTFDALHALRSADSL